MLISDTVELESCRRQYLGMLSSAIVFRLLVSTKK